MTEKLESYDREHLKAYFEQRFGKMLEMNELTKQNLSGDGPQIILSPGNDKWIYPAFQFRKDGKPHKFLKPLIDTIKISSNNHFLTGAMLCEWLFKPDDEITPLMLLKKGHGIRLLQKGDKFGKNLLPRIPTT